MVFTELPFEVVRVDKELLKKELQSSQYERDGWQVGPKKYFIPISYNKCGLDIYNFEARKDDVFLVGLPRSGTTMHCEMVWLISNDLNYAKAQEKNLDLRFGHIDGALMRDLIDESYPTDNTFDRLKNDSSQRFMKAHLPLSLLPPSIFESGAKVIYCARNPKDMIVSLMRVYNIFCGQDDSKDQIPELLRAFKANLVPFTPLFEHVKEAWAKRNDKNLLFLFYEDTIKDKKQTIMKVADFFNKKLTGDQIDELLDHMSIENFRKNKAVNLEQLNSFFKKEGDFIRKGKPGGWRDYFEGDLAKEVDQWIEENLKDTDLIFPEV